MPVSRRGLLAAVGLTGLAGCEGLRSGSPEAGPVTFERGGATAFRRAISAAAGGTLEVVSGTYRFDPVGPATGGGAHPHFEVTP